MDAATHLHLIRNLTGPLQAGAVSTELTIGPDGVVDIDWNSREPLLLAAPSRHLSRQAWRLTATLASGTALRETVFEAYTEPGAFLPLYRPAVTEETSTAAPFGLSLGLTVQTPGTEPEAVPPADLNDFLQVHLLEGLFGRLLYLLGAEKVRLRRQLNELGDLRLLEHAHRNALDRLGADLGVPRFGLTASASDRETDLSFRRRLALFQPWMVPDRAGLEQRLNGSADGKPGLLAPLGVTAQASLIEVDNPFAVAVKLVATDPATRMAFLEHLREHHLIVPADTAAANDLHGRRYLPSMVRARADELRRNLRVAFTLPDEAGVAPPLAHALERAGSCRDALGESNPWILRRAQDPEAGSRYELGLGADLAPLTQAALGRMATALTNPDRPRADPAVEALLSTMRPRSAADDPEGHWFLEPCGFRTVHRINTQRVFLSTLPTFGLVLDGPSSAPADSEQTYSARYEAAGSPHKHALLREALDVAQGDWSDAGHAPWTELSDEAGREAWERVRDRPEALDVLAAAGLVGTSVLAPVLARLRELPDELLATLRLPDTLAAGIVTGEASVVDELKELRETLERAGIPAALPLVTDTDEVLLVTSVVSLPHSGLNLSERRAAGFRWFSVPIGMPVRSRGSLRAVGARADFGPLSPGLYALIVLGYARRGLTDPYEVRVEFPEGTTLDADQYEYLMNLLEHVHPLGVEVNTFAVRRHHVDLDGDGVAEPLTPDQARAYRQFRRKRQRGEVDSR